MQIRSGTRWALTTVLICAAGAGCGPAFVQVGADVAGGSMKGATHAVAHGNNASTADAAGLALGVGLMVAGYKLTEPDQRQNANPAYQPTFVNGAPPPIRQ
jgi:hypothetical protein